jgi:hypothetical protein
MRGPGLRRQLLHLPGQEDGNRCTVDRPLHDLTPDAIVQQPIAQTVGLMTKERSLRCRFAHLASRLASEAAESSETSPSSKAPSS